jgi:hypothetical protein
MARFKTIQEIEKERKKKSKAVQGWIPAMNYLSGLPITDEQYEKIEKSNRQDGCKLTVHPEKNIGNNSTWWINIEMITEKELPDNE